MTVSVKRGDLLREEVDAIVNTVNCVGVMGKGIALQFKQKWPQNFKLYEAACKRQDVRIGRMFIYDAGGLTRPSFIINFPTKDHWRGKSKLEYITSGLKDLVSEIQRLKIKSIALPPLGCGNGGLDWDVVRPEIIKAFNTIPDVQVSLFEPSGAPAPQAMENRTTIPNMTPTRAALVKLLSIYREMQYALSHLEVQKLAYLLEEAGQPLNLKFEKNKYGPYSDTLRHALKRMDGHYIRGVGDYAGEAEIVVVPEALKIAERVLDEDDDDTRRRVDRVARLIEGFETPYGMELLATVHWVSTREPIATSADEAIHAVHGWNDRKRATFAKEHIVIAWNKLQASNWIVPAPK